VGRLAQWADQVAVNEQRVARTRASHGNHSAVLANALFELHLASVQDAKDPRAERAALEAAEIFKHLGAGEAVVAGTIARMAAAQAAQDLGALVEASRAGVTAFETYAPEAEGVLYAWKSLATNLELAGRPAEAVSAYERAVARYHATGKEDRVLLRGLLKSLADMQLDSGKPEAALETLARGIALLGETPPEKDESGLHVLKGRTLLALGRHVEAIAILDRLVEPARARPNKGRFAMICWSLAQALHASGGPRSQALALAGDAERAFLVAIEAASKHWMAVNIARDYERRRAEVRAWIAAHRR
jgi:tetratricopeptide (TPR) repeat protein